MTTQNIYNLADTWNAGATTFTAIKMNVTDTASAAGSLLMDLQVGGSSRFYVDKAGYIKPSSGYIIGSGFATDNSGGNRTVVINANGTQIRSNSYFAWGSTTTDAGGAPDLLLTRRAAANIRFGAADAAAPVAQTLSVQSVVAGTTNTAGANLTITGSQGTGTGAGGSIIFQVAPAGSSGSAQNALADILTLQSANREATFTGWIRQTGTVISLANANFGAYNGAANLEVNQSIGLSSGTIIGFVPDVIIRRDAANTLALRNGANAQTFNIYNTFTDASNYERFRIDWATAGRVTIGPQWAGTGTAKNLYMAVPSGGYILSQSNGAILFGVDGVIGERWSISSSGHLLAGTDNTYDIGASAASRPRNVYVGNDVQAAGNVTVATGSLFRFTGRGSMWATADGVFQFSNNLASDFGRINFGGSTSSFPAIKRSSTTLQARLADDSAFASVQGKLTTDTAYAAGDPTTTGYLVVYDSTGTAYKIPAVAV